MNLRPLSRGPPASSRRHALFLRGLEKMDSTFGGRAVHTAAPSRATLLHLGAAEVGGKITQLIQLRGRFLPIDPCGLVTITQH